MAAGSGSIAVDDPDLINRLEAAQAAAPGPVTDPEVLKRLEQQRTSKAWEAAQEDMGGVILGGVHGLVHGLIGQAEAIPEVARHINPLLGFASDASNAFLPDWLTRNPHERADVFLHKPKGPIEQGASDFGTGVSASLVTPISPLIGGAGGLLGGLMSRGGEGGQGWPVAGMPELDRFLGNMAVPGFATAATHIPQIAGAVMQALELPSIAHSLLHMFKRGTAAEKPAIGPEEPPPKPSPTPEEAQIPALLRPKIEGSGQTILRDLAWALVKNPMIANSLRVAGYLGNYPLVNYLGNQPSTMQQNTTE